MLKLETPADLEKFAKGLGSHFAKAADAYEQVAGHHATVAKAHGDHATLVKAKADALPDDHVDKAYFHKVAEHHVVKAAHHEELNKLHKALAEQHDGMSASLTGDKSTKAAEGTTVQDPSPKTGEGVNALIDSTTERLVAKALEAIDTDPEVKKKIQETILNKINDALADRVRPDGVTGALPTRPTVVPRSGGQQDLIKAEGVAPELQHLVEAPEA